MHVLTYILLVRHTYIHVHICITPLGAVVLSYVCMYVRVYTVYTYSTAHFKLDTHTRVCTRACTRLTRVKVNNLACIVSAACEFGVRTNARGILVMHDTNMLAMCTRFAI